MFHDRLLSLCFRGTTGLPAGVSRGGRLQKSWERAGRREASVFSEPTERPPSETLLWEVLPRAIGKACTVVNIPIHPAFEDLEISSTPSFLRTAF